LRVPQAATLAAVRIEHPAFPEAPGGRLPYQRQLNQAQAHAGAGAAFIVGELPEGERAGRDVFAESTDTSQLWQ